MIYLILDQVSNAVKIGYCKTDALRRLSHLQTGNPNKLILLGVAEGGLGAESKLHRLFAPYKIIGEWFEADSIPEKIGEIENILLTFDSHYDAGYESWTMGRLRRELENRNLPIPGKRSRRIVYLRRNDRANGSQLCACGCGRDIPPHRINLGGNQRHPSYYFNQACKQRAYRRRRQGQIK